MWSYKSIQLVVAGEDEDAAVLAAGARLAADFGARVEVTPAFPDPASTLLYYGGAFGAAVDAVALQTVLDAEKAALARIDALARAVASSAGVAMTGDGASLCVHPRPLLPAAALARASVLTDLAVFGAEAARKAFVLRGLFAETLLSSRTPVYLVKDNAKSGGPAAIAWDGSPQAGRAVRAALPMLQAAPETVVIQHKEEISEGAREGSDPALLSAYLRRHEVANVRMADLTGAGFEQNLLAAADACSLLVAGAYGHPRLYELILGGTTQFLVEARAGPNLLLAH